MSIKKIIPAVGAALMLVASYANAGLMTTGSVYNNTGGEYSSSYNVDLLSDQSGLSSAYVDGVTDFATYTASGVTHATSEGGGGVAFLSGVQSRPFLLDFDIGSTQNIFSLALWNSAAGNNASVNSFEVFTSLTSDFSVSTLVGSFINPLGLNTAEPVTVFDLTDTVAQYVRISVLSNYGNNCCTVIGEVAFDATATSVPEPSTLAIFALGMIGLVSRRSKK